MGFSSLASHHPHPLPPAVAPGTASFAWNSLLPLAWCLIRNLPIPAQCHFFQEAFPDSQAGSDLPTWWDLCASPVQLRGPPSWMASTVFPPGTVRPTRAGSGSAFAQLCPSAVWTQTKTNHTRKAKAMCSGPPAAREPPIITCVCQGPHSGRGKPQALTGSGVPYVSG